MCSMVIDMCMLFSGYNDNAGSQDSSGEDSSDGEDNVDSSPVSDNANTTEVGYQIFYAYTMYHPTCLRQYQNIS